MGNSFRTVRHHGSRRGRHCNKRRRCSARLRKTFGGTPRRVLQRGVDYESSDCLLQAPHESLSSRLGDVERKRNLRLLYAFKCGKYPRQHEPLQTPGTQRRFVFDFDSSRRDD